MADIQITDKAAKYIDKLMETADREKAAIADALTTASEALAEHEGVDQDEYLNVCAVLGRYNRLLSLLA